MSVVLPDIAPDAAVIIVAPAPAPDARPLEFTVATVVLSEDHSTLAEMSADVPSEYVPVAMNWFVNPFAIDGFTGVTAMV